MGMVEIIGNGFCVDDLTENHKKIIKKADLLVGGKRYLDFFKDVNARKLAITNNISFIVTEIKKNMAAKKVVVLASGDPLFFGMGATLARELGKENIIVHPNISSVQAAFAAIKEPWHDAKIISFHGRKAPDLDLLLQREDKIAILTDPETGPCWIAQRLVEKKNLDFRMSVLENLRTEREKITWFEDMEKVTEKKFLSPNIVILFRKKRSNYGTVERMQGTESIKQSTKKCVQDAGDMVQSAEESMHGTWDKMQETGGSMQGRENRVESCKEQGEPDIEKIALSGDIKIYPGMPDDYFAHENGLITKAEIRSLVLSKLKLVSDNHIFWDLGAGSGSVSIEVSRFIPHGTIISVEKNLNRITDIKKNIENFKVSNIRIVHADLPNGIEELGIPDRIFIGGGGAELLKIMKLAGKKLVANGIMVVNTVLIQNIEPALNLLRLNGFDADLIQVQVSVLKTMPFGERLEALNSVWIISGKKKGNSVN